MAQDTILYLVIPCYNEQEVLPDSEIKLKEKMDSLIQKKKISPQSKVCLLYTSDAADEYMEIDQTAVSTEHPVFRDLPGA